MNKRKRVYHMIDGEILTDEDYERMADDFATRDFDYVIFCVTYIDF